MVARDHGELTQMLPRLRHDFETSKRLVARARERAARLSDEAVALRRLLESRARHPRPALTPAAEVWHAAAREIVRAARERDRELGIVGHELRQPLAAALAADRLLAVTERPDEAARARSVLSRQLLQLSELIESLLEYSRFSANQPLPDNAVVDIHEIVRDALESIEAVAAERRQQVRGPCPGRSAVMGDRTRLRQVVSNLLQNAVRYTPEGGQIQVCVTTRDGSVEVEVRDTGAGIPADQLDAIFDPFVRLSSAGPGLGVGLALVRRIVELHGGSVRAASAGPGRGSVFTIVLPRASDPRGAVDGA